MIRTEQFNLFLATVALATLIAGVCEAQQAAPPPPSEPAKLSVVQLKADVDNILACDDVTIRRDVGRIFALVDRLMESKREDEALRYLSPALKHNSWALDYQILNASLLQARGDTNTPRRVSDLVMEYAEEDKQINAARQLVGKPPLPKLARLGAIGGASVTLALIPVGNANVCVLEDVRSRLADELGLSVIAVNAGIVAPAYKRDPFQQGLLELRQRLRFAAAQEPKVADFLKQNSIAIETLGQDNSLVEAYRRLIFAFDGTNALENFDAGIAYLKNADKQWDVEDIEKSLAAAVDPCLRDNLYFLAITDLDIFADGSNFIFYRSESPGNHSVTSYRRFTANFNADTPNRKRLVERTVKSGLACVGFMLGVQRCADPTCPRVYPHSLRELDACSLRLCDACQKGFQSALGASRQTNEKRQGPIRQGL